MHVSCTRASRILQKRNDGIIHTALQRILAVSPRPQAPIATRLSPVTVRLFLYIEFMHKVRP
jgi:hypothetical protein